MSQKLKRRNKITILCSASANLCQCQHFNQRWSQIRIWIVRLIQIRMSARSFTKCYGFYLLLARVTLPSFVKIGRWLYVKIPIPYSAMVRKMEKWPRIDIWDCTPPKVNQFFRLVGPIMGKSYLHTFLKRTQYRILWDSFRNHINSYNTLVPI